jgi:hypothetical protein
MDHVRNATLDSRRINPGNWPCNQPSVAANPAQPNTIVVAAYEHRADNRQISLHRSTDAGRSFTEILLPVPDGFKHIGAAMVTADSTGLFVVAGEAYNDPGLDGSIAIYTSLDNGQTFGAPVIARRGMGLEAFHDKPCVSIDQSPRSRFHGRIYLSYTGFVDNLEQKKIYVQCSDDQGATWSAPGRVSELGTNVHGSSIATDPNGSLYVGWIHHGPGEARFLVRRSDDGGRSFGTRRTVWTMNILPSPLVDTAWAFRVPTFANLAADTSGGPHRGTIYAVWQHDRSGSSDILLARSSDRGRSWVYPTKVNDSKSGVHDFFPALSVSPTNGTIHVVYYSNRVSPSKLDVFAARSRNGGTSFGHSHRLTESSFDPNGDDGFGRPNQFLGDYIGAAGLSENRLFAAWTDTRGGHQAIYVGGR